MNGNRTLRALQEEESGTFVAELTNETKRLLSNSGFLEKKSFGLLLNEFIHVAQKERFLGLQMKGKDALHGVRANKLNQIDLISQCIFVFEFEELKRTSDVDLWEGVFLAEDVRLVIVLGLQTREEFVANPYQILLVCQ